jgi:hypothetical protein
MASRCLSAGGVRFWDPHVPPAEWGRPSEDRRADWYRREPESDRKGVATFRTEEKRRGWVPSLPRGRWVSQQEESCLATGVREPVFQTRYRRINHRFRRPHYLGAFTKVQWFTRPDFPWPGSSQWFDYPWAFTPCTRRSGYPDPCGAWEPAWTRAGVMALAP